MPSGSKSGRGRAVTGTLGSGSWPSAPYATKEAIAAAARESKRGMRRVFTRRLLIVVIGKAALPRPSGGHAFIPSEIAKARLRGPGDPELLGPRRSARRRGNVKRFVSGRKGWRGPG